MKVSELNDELYEIFKGLPSNAPIVRNNIKNDAFPLTTLKILYGTSLDIEFDASQALDLAKYVIAPPDGGIDIFVEHQEDDDYWFDVIQVKYCHMKLSEIKNAFSRMRKTIDDFCNDASNIQSVSCREILSASNINKSNKRNCHYYVVHTGRCEFNNLTNNETVLNEKYLNDMYYNGMNKVAYGTFVIEKNNNLIHNSESKDYNATVLTLSCYELAILNNKFDKAMIGRNILFGQNLRDGLPCLRNKTFEIMKYTIINEPELFWCYNNGVTIIADKFYIDNKRNDIQKLVLKGFSIINGAQTTSALGYLLKSFLRNKENDYIDSLKNAFVLVRIISIKNEDIKRNVAIYNNSQNCILNRDLVANRQEQLILQKHLLNNSIAKIYMEIRRGAAVPSNFNRKIKHRITKNETLAQVAYAAFEIEPFTAKDKKSALFSFSYSKHNYTINEYYHNLFNYDAENSNMNGVLFKKTIEEIDEALFVLYLYNEGGRIKRRELRQNIADYKRIVATADRADRIQENIEADANVLETIGSCKFYCISTYYLFKERFDIVKNRKTYDYNRFYEDKTFKDNLIKDFANLFLMNTIRVLNQTAHDNNKTGNIANWLRGKACQDAFIASLKCELTLNGYLKEYYFNFMSKYKIKLQEKLSV